MQIMSVIKSQKSSSFLLQNASATIGLGLASSLLLCALRPFPTWVDISQQCLMYIWPLMLSLHVPEPEAQLKLTTPEALPPSLEPTPCLFRLFLPHPLLFPSYIVPLGSSPRALLLLCASAPSSPPHLWFPPPPLLFLISPLFYLQCSPNTRVPPLLCSLISFLYCHMAIYHLWAHRFRVASHLGNSSAGNLRTPISTYCSFPDLIHGPLHVEAISSPHLFLLKRIC